MTDDAYEAGYTEDELRERVKRACNCLSCREGRPDRDMWDVDPFSEAHALAFMMWLGVLVLFAAGLGFAMGWYS